MNTKTVLKTSIFLAALAAALVLTGCEPGPDELRYRLVSALRNRDIPVAGEVARQLVVLEHEGTEGTATSAPVYMNLLRTGIDTASMDEDWAYVVILRDEACRFAAFADSAVPGWTDVPFDGTTFGLPARTARREYLEYLSEELRTVAQEDSVRRRLLFSERRMITTSFALLSDSLSLMQVLNEAAERYTPTYDPRRRFSDVPNIDIGGIDTIGLSRVPGISGIPVDTAGTARVDCMETP